MAILTKYIGLDVHRDTISIAVADDGGDREVRFFGTVANDCTLLDKALASIGKDGTPLKVCDEAGPCGFLIHRFLKSLGIDCVVISPSSMPRRPNDRVKPTAAMRRRRPGCCAPVNSPPSGCRTRRMRRSAMWCGHAGRQSRIWFRRRTR